MTFIIDIILQVIVAIIVPLLIIKKIYTKTGHVRKIIILPFFLLNWVLQAFLAVLFWGTMNSTFVWLCDLCVFALPIVSVCIANRIYIFEN